MSFRADGLTWASFPIGGVGPVELVLLAIVALLVYRDRNVTLFRGER